MPPKPANAAPDVDKLSAALVKLQSTLTRTTTAINKTTKTNAAAMGALQVSFSKSINSVKKMSAANIELMARTRQLTEMKIKAEKENEERRTKTEAKNKEIFTGAEGGVQKFLDRAKLVQGVMSGSTESTGGMLRAFMKLGNAFGPVGVGVGLLSALLITGLVGAVRKTFEASKSLTASLGFMNAGLHNSVQFGKQTALASALYGVKQEEMSAILKSLSNNMLLTSMATKNMGTIWANTVGESIGQFMGMAKYAGMSADQAGRLASNLVMLGNTADQLPAAFAKFQVWAGELEMAPDVLMDALGGIAPVSLTSATAARTMINTFASFKKTFKDATDPVGEFIKNAPGGGKLMGDAMQSFASAAGDLTTPEMIAMGGGMNPGTDTWGAIQAALSSGNDRFQILTNYLQTVAKGAPGGTGDKNTAIFMMLTQRFGIEMSRANTLTGMIVNLNKEQMKAARNGDVNKTELARKQLQVAAALNGAMEDPMQKLVNLMSALVAQMAALLNIVSPGMGTTMSLNLQDAAVQKAPAGFLDKGARR